MGTMLPIRYVWPQTMAKTHRSCLATTFILQWRMLQWMTDMWVKHWEYARSMCPPPPIVGERSVMHPSLCKSWGYRNALLSCAVQHGRVQYRRWFQGCLSKRRQAHKVLSKKWSTAHLTLTWQDVEMAQSIPAAVGQSCQEKTLWLCLYSWPCYAYFRGKIMIHSRLKTSRHISELPRKVLIHTLVSASC